MTIGVYDSGIGGLSTLKELIKTLGGHDYFYYADNANMPYGTKEPFDIYKAVRAGLDVLNANSDVQVIACNTASTVTSPASAFLLKPSIDTLQPSTTLILATPATLRALKANERMFNTADTKELATLIEIAASLGYKKQSYGQFDLLREYLYEKLKGYNNVKKVLLGCSHYHYVKHIVKTLFPDAEINDGNNELAALIANKIKVKPGTEKVAFRFSGGNEEKKYRWLLNNLLNND